METHSALADVKEDEATVWIRTKHPFGKDSQIGSAIGMNAAKIRIITPYVGGGFGGESLIGLVLQAACFSRIVKSPVQMTWTR